jgi:hypothetical protein
VARINIEDKIYRDERFHRLSAFEGKYKALGLCVTAWDLAHRWYLKHPEHLIPLAEWDASEELRLLEKYGLAERHENGIYVKGSKDECDYLTKRSDAGRKGGLKSQENFSSKTKQIEQNQPSSSSSFSSSNSNSKNINTYAQSKLIAEVYPSDLLPVSETLAERGVKLDLAIQWLALYSAEFIVREIQSAIAWELSNPKKAKKNFSRFMTGWLSRGWLKNKTTTTAREVVSTKKVSFR